MAFYALVTEVEPYIDPTDNSPGASVRALIHEPTRVPKDTNEYAFQTTLSLVDTTPGIQDQIEAALIAKAAEGGVTLTAGNIRWL